MCEGIGLLPRRSPPEEQYRVAWPIADGTQERSVGDELEGVARADSALMTTPVAAAASVPSH